MAISMKYLGPVAPHLSKGELADLRSDVTVAFERMETPGEGGTGVLALQEWTNPLAADDDYVLTSTSATSAAHTVTTLTSDTLPHARNLTVTCTITGTGAGNVVVVGTDVDGKVLTETFAVPSSTAVVTGCYAFKTVTSVTIPAVTTGMTALAVKVGSGNKLGLGSPGKLRNSLPMVLHTLMDGALLRECHSQVFLAPAAKGTNYVTQYAAGAALNDTTSTFTKFYPPRNVNIVLGSGGANPVVVTITGLDYKGTTISEAFTCTGAGTYVGTKAFASITGVASDINPAGTVDVKTGDGIGLAGAFGSVACLLQGATSDTVAASDPATGLVRPTTVPNGTLNFTVVTGKASTVTTPTVGAPHGTFLPATVPDGAHDYVLCFERDTSD